MKNKFNIKGIKELPRKEQKQIEGGGFIGKVVRGLGYVIGVIGAVASDIVAGGGNFVGD